VNVPENSVSIPENVDLILSIDPNAPEDLSNP
jgi:hypothetical protein